MRYFKIIVASMLYHLLVILGIFKERKENVVEMHHK